MYDYILPHPDGTFMEIRPFAERVQDHSVIIGRCWHVYDGIWVRGGKWVLKVLSRIA